MIIIIRVRNDLTFKSHKIPISGPENDKLPSEVNKEKLLFTSRKSF